MSIIKGTPTDGLTYNPNDPNYWDKSLLAKELERIYEICHGCRLCFNLCPSFPALFQAVDKHDGDVRKLTAAESDYVVDTCFQCKICYVKCPYTPDDNHEFQLDFPRLMLRAVAQRSREKGISLRSRMLSRPELVGQIGGATPDIANWANKQPLLRGVMESVVGIHKNKQLPEFHAQTFADWYQSHPPPAGDPNLAVLFHTCYVNYNAPELGKDAVSVYSRNGISLGCPKQNCCGMPALEAGDIPLAKDMAASNVASLLPHVNQGKKVVAINPTCSYMLRKEYTDLLGTDASRKVAANTMDLCEFLFHRKQQGHFNRDFQSTPGRIAYHVPCHLKAQNIGFRSRDMMRLIPGAKVTMVEQCSAHDGTWAMKKEFFPLSMLTAKKAFNEMKEVKGDLMASDCPLAAIQFEQGTGTRPIHPIQVLERAYRPDGFPQPIEKKEDK